MSFVVVLSRTDRCKMALIDMFQLTHDMTIFGQNILTVYHVERANSGEVSRDISDAFQVSVVPDIRALQSDAVVNNDLKVFNLGNPTDFGTFTLGAAVGLRTGLDSPSFIAASIRFNTLNRLVRSGQKRYPGLLETDYADGILLTAALTLIDAVGSACVGDWLDPIDSHVVCNYAIIKRVCEETDPVTGKCLEYRLPETDEKLIFYLPATFLSNPNVSSQVSRKTF